MSESKTSGLRLPLAFVAAISAITVANADTAQITPNGNSVGKAISNPMRMAECCEQKCIAGRCWCTRQCPRGNPPATLSVRG